MLIVSVLLVTLAAVSASYLLRGSKVSAKSH